MCIGNGGLNEFTILYLRVKIPNLCVVVNSKRDFYGVSLNFLGAYEHLDSANSHVCSWVPIS